MADKPFIRAGHVQVHLGDPGCPGKIHPAVLMRIAAPVRQMQGHKVQMRAGAKAAIGGRFLFLAQQQPVAIDLPARLDPGSDDGNRQHRAAHRVQRHMAAHASLALDQPCIRERLQRAVDRRPGDAEFPGKIRLVGEPCAGGPDAGADTAQDLGLDVLPALQSVSLSGAMARA